MQSLAEEAARMTEAAMWPAQERHAGDLIGYSWRPTLHVMDDVLPMPLEYRRRLLALPFHDVSVGPVTFHGIADVDDTAMAEAVTSRWPELEPRMTFARLSPSGQVEPHFIHTDRDMGEWTAVLYLTDPPDPSDGTMFWADCKTDICLSTGTLADLPAEHLAWRELGRWKLWRAVEAKFNRLVLFPAGAFHSRAIEANYGTGVGARLTQVMFGTFKETL